MIWVVIYVPMFFLGTLIILARIRANQLVCNYEEMNKKNNNLITISMKDIETLAKAREDKKKIEKKILNTNSSERFEMLDIN